jgi:transmembrane sensor
VLGTGFNVASNPKSNQSSVYVEHGRVRVGKSNTKVELVTGQAVREETNQLVRFSVNDPNIISWKTGILEFDKQTLEDVCVSLSHHFEVEVKCDVAVGVEVITTTLDHLNLNESLTLICETLGLRYQTTNGVYTISR